eukprot:GDKI01020721.1.p3 GENE.GDKI01020721.1~~GDKI01020721.1.p3  ORF type:complete len:113 (+),score=30.47 GDKI01020721.1:838-1176(+)
MNTERQELMLDEMDSWAFNQQGGVRKGAIEGESDYVSDVQEEEDEQTQHMGGGVADSALQKVEKNGEKGASGGAGGDLVQEVSGIQRAPPDSPRSDTSAVRRSARLASKPQI